VVSCPKETSFGNYTRSASCNFARAKAHNDDVTFTHLSFSATALFRFGLLFGPPAFHAGPAALFVVSAYFGPRLAAFLVHHKRAAPANNVDRPTFLSLPEASAIEPVPATAAAELHVVARLALFSAA